jgi:hypothetical protein
MSLDAALEAHSQLAKCCQPGMCSLDHPGVAPEPVIALDAPAGDTVLNATALGMVAAPMEVVALVDVQALGPASWPARQAPYSGQVVDELFEDDRVVPVGSRDAEHQRDACSVGHDVAFAAELAAVGRVGARVRTLRGLGTLAPSMLARLKSKRPAPRSSASSIRCSWCHTPAACHSRSLRQHVMPLPKPSSWGKSSQAMPVRSTKRMPLRASSSSRRGRPPLGQGFTTGNSGSRRFHSAALISFFLLMRHRTHHLLTAMTGIVRPL